MIRIRNLIKSNLYKAWKASVLNEELIEIHDESAVLPTINSRVMLYMHSDSDIIDAYSNRKIGRHELPITKGTVINVGKRSASVKLDNPISEKFLLLCSTQIKPKLRDGLKNREESTSSNGIRIMVKKIK